MPVFIIKLGTPRRHGEGLRLGTVRRPPRGVPKADFARLDYYDVWYPELAPSVETMKLGQSAADDRQWEVFARAFRREMAQPAAARTLYVLAIPQAQGDLYNLPADVLTAIRNVVCRDLYVRLEAPSQVSLFVYDNDTFIAESFRESAGAARIVTDKRIGKLRELLSGREITGQPRGDRMVFDVFVRPGAYGVFSAAQ